MHKPGQSDSEQEQPQAAKPDLGDQLPENFPVSVILESRPAKSEWIDTVWQITGVAVGSRTDAVNEKPRQIHVDGDITQYICNGLRVALYKDECESYYHNLMSPEPRCYVVAHVEGDEEPPDPFLVTLSFDAAHAYLEGEDDIYGVDIPPELYRWTEAFVLVNYAPEKRIKRKRKDWKEQERSS